MTLDQPPPEVLQSEGLPPVHRFEKPRGGIPKHVQWNISDDDDDGNDARSTSYPDESPESTPSPAGHVIFSGRQRTAVADPLAQRLLTNYKGDENQSVLRASGSVAFKFPLVAELLTELDKASPEGTVDYMGFESFTKCLTEEHGLVRLDQLVEANGGETNGPFLAGLIPGLKLGPANTLFNAAAKRVASIRQNQHAGGQ